jgi:DNA polymerase III sliding clamp (beta) subunit (PCNA family)
MATMEEQLAEIPKSTAIAVIDRPERKAKIQESDAIPYREVEVLSKEEEKHQHQLKKKAKKPATSFVSSAALTSRQIIGVEVDSETLFGFLAAAERIVPVDKETPILSSIKLTHEPESERMFIEAVSTKIWTAVAIKVAPRGSQGFEVMVPARHAKNIVNAMRDSFKTVLIGMSDGGFWIGQHCVPGGGNPRDYPGRPLIRQWDTRAVVPAFYFDEICSRVLTSTSKDPTKPGLHGVLLDFSVEKDRTVCTAVSSDGARMHIFELPQMRIQSKSPVPPSIMVGEHFFRYLRTVANREWTAIEISEKQISGKGEDYFAVAGAKMKGAAGNGLDKWRSVDVDYPGCWVVDRKEIERVIRRAKTEGTDERIELRIDVDHEKLEVWFYNNESRKIHESIGAKRFDGPSIVDVPINVNFLLDAVVACKSGLIRLGFAGPKEQGRSPVTIRGEDDQFKAIVMPIG